MNAKSNTVELNLALPLRSQGAAYVPKGFSQRLAQRRRSDRPPPLDLSWTASLTRPFPYVVVPAHRSRPSRPSAYWTPQSGSMASRAEELGAPGPAPPIPPRAAARTKRLHNPQVYDNACGWTRENWREELMLTFLTWAYLVSMFMMTRFMLRLACRILDPIPPRTPFQMVRPER